jgi:hypothetical protein
VPSSPTDREIDQKDHPDIDEPQLQDVAARFAQGEQEGQQQQDDGEGAGIDRVEQTGDDHGGQKLGQVGLADRQRPHGDDGLGQGLLEWSVDWEGGDIALPGP